MTAGLIFLLANGMALLGWLVLVFAIVTNRNVLRDHVAGRAAPLILAALYAALVALFFFKAEGGFDSLANVQRLFTSPWVAVAGWVHYLCFDLFIGSLIAKRVMENGLPRLTLIVLLPLTFIFGPAGYLGFELVRFLFTRESDLV